MREIHTDEMRKIQLHILGEVDLWCKTHGVRYFLYYGTLLGAVRHKGYIPWDDDIDIAMLRSDYDLFISGFNQNRDDSLRVLHSSNDPAYPLEFAKVSDTKTVVNEKNRLAYHWGINIDVFPLDYISEENARHPEMYLQEARQLSKCMFWSLCELDQLPFYKKARRWTLSKIFNIKWCQKRFDKLAAREKGTTTHYVACVSNRDFKKNDILDIAWLQEDINMQFEQESYPVPKNYDAVLTALYGDYMALPPVEERIPWHGFTCYEK